jgi:1,4-dihydroxy-2-naphthoyl-CoA synthase
MVGQQVLQVKQRLAYMTEEAEGRNAFLEKRQTLKKWLP